MKHNASLAVYACKFLHAVQGGIAKLLVELNNNCKQRSASHYSYALLIMFFSNNGAKAKIKLEPSESSPYDKNTMP